MATVTGCVRCSSWTPSPSAPLPQHRDVAHRKPLSEGGKNDLSNIEPKTHSEHVEEHKKRGDFKRWGAKGAKAKKLSPKKKLSPPKTGSKVGLAD